MNADNGRDAVVQRIRSFLADECYVKLDEIDNDTELFTSGRLSSLDMIDLASFIEREYGIEAADADVSVEHFDTVNLVAGFIDARR